jgi:hypothetical protein
LLCRVNGYVSSVSLRLFRNWKDNALLYVFILSSTTIEYNIKNRYAISPQRNTTEWQTIKIPSHALPILMSDLLAIGMQESSNTSEIYTMKNDFFLSGNAININKYTMSFIPQTNFAVSIAYSYTVVHNGKKIFY